MNQPVKPTVYPPAEPSPSFPKLEEGILKLWETESCFASYRGGA